MARRADGGGAPTVGFIREELRFVMELVDRAMAGLKKLDAARAQKAPWDEAGAARESLRLLTERDPLADEYLALLEAGHAEIETLAQQLKKRLGIGPWTDGTQTAKVQLDRVREHVVDLRMHYASTLATRDEPEETTTAAFRVSQGRPVMREIDSSALAPFHRRFVGDAAEPQTGETTSEPPRGQLESTAESALLSLAGAWRSRRVEGHRPWHQGVPPLEQRLLDDLDAFVGLAGYTLRGRLAGPLQPPAIDTPALASGCDIMAVLADYTGRVQRDELRAFAQSFVLGCFEGGEPLRMAVMGLRQAHPDTYRAHAEALALAPHQGITQAMEELAASPDAPLVRVALDVLRRRRQCSFEVVAPLLAHPDRGVRQAAAQALVYAPNREACTAILEATVETEFDERVTATAAESLLRLDHPRGLSLVRTRLTEERHAPHGLTPAVKRHLLRLLAMGGDGRDLELLLALAHEPEEIALIGWHGHGNAIEPLLALLEVRASSLLLGGALGETRPQAAARALQRITGAFDQDESTSTARSRYARVDAVSTDSQRWRDWFAAHRDTLSMRSKLRWGKPYQPQPTMDELLRPGVAWDVRRLAELELALVVDADAVALLPDLEDWVAEQRAAVAALQHHLTKQESPQGMVKSKGD